jgi:predicted GNAT family N-acyltransferase
MELLKARDPMIRAANGEADIEKIFAFNHQIFASEIGQHPESNSLKLIDAFHSQNEYFIAEKNDSMVGMICLTSPNQGRFSVDSKMDPTLLSQDIRSKSIEVRLLAVLGQYRGTSLAIRLMVFAAEKAISRGFSFGLISAIHTQVPLYKKFGFSALAPSVKIRDVSFLPMIVTLQDLSRAFSSQVGIASKVSVRAERRETLA